MLLSSLLQAQNDPIPELQPLPAQGWTDIFSVADKVLEARENRKDDPVREARAKVITIRATKKQLKTVLDIQKKYDRGEITYSAYIHLMASGLQISIAEYLEMQNNISEHGLRFDGVKSSYRIKP